MDKKSIITNSILSGIALVLSTLFIILSNLKIVKFTKNIINYDGSISEHEFKFKLFSFVSSGNKPLANISLAVFIITIVVAIAGFILSFFIKNKKVNNAIISVLLFFIVATLICFFNMIGYSNDLILTI